MQRFYIEENQIKNNTITIPKKDSNYKHITKVLRMEKGDEIYCSFNKFDYITKIQEIKEEEVLLLVEEVRENDTEPKTFISLYQGLPKQDKLELIIQKSVELGVSKITPVETKFCIAKINKKSKEKTTRLQKISENASYQCGRGIVPKVNEPITFKQLLSLDFSDALNIVAYEKEEVTTIKDLLKANQNIKKVNIFVGAEGGFSEDEIEKLKEKGFSTITLGKRILRTETAPLNLISNIIYEYEM